MVTLLVSMVLVSTILAFETATSNCLIFASNIPWASFAASYSAFSFKSPFSRASPMALEAAGRSTDFMRCNSSRILSNVSCVTYMLISLMIFHLVIKKIQRHKNCSVAPYKDIKLGSNYGQFF